MARLELSRTLSIAADEAWQHASDLYSLGDWLTMHQGWRGELPTELTEGATIVGVAGSKGFSNRVTWTVREFDPPHMLAIAGDGVGGAKYKLRMTVAPVDAGCRFSVKIDLGGRPLFGPVGMAAARVLKGDIERSIGRFEELYG